MTKYLLDTNICIFFLRGKFHLNEKFKSIGLENCCISEITLAELKYGAECSSKVNENNKMIDAFAKEIQVIPIISALDIYAKEKARLKKQGVIIDDFDLLIGSTAISSNMIMVTDNEKHLKRLSKVKIENWISR
jgi:tRNA(fMet)-specific endonuclease VapC